MKIGYSTYGFETVPLEESLPHIASLGFQGVEICSLPGYAADIDLLHHERVREIKASLADLGLEVAAVAAHTAFLAPEPQKRAESAARLQRNLDLAAELGAPAVVALSGRAPQGWTEERAWEVLVQGLEDVAGYAEGAGVAIAFEPHIDMLIDSAPKMLRLLELVSSPSLKVNLDTSHFAVLGQDIPQAVRELAPFTIQAHLKDTRGLHPDFEFLTPGEGDFDFTGLFRALKAAGYRGYVTTEISVMRRRKPDYDPFRAAELSFSTIARALREAGAS